MDAVRGFLVGKNDAGELNLNKLCLVGSGMGASVAANWALTGLVVSAARCGQAGPGCEGIVIDIAAVDVQRPHDASADAIPGAEEECSLDDDLRRQGRQGSNRYGRIKKQLERFHPTTAQKKPAHASGLTVLGLQTKLQGDSLLTQNSASTEKEIVEFLVDNVAKSDMPWISRRNRLP